MKDRAASPWSDQSDSSLARDAGIDDIGSNRDRGDDTRHAGLYDQSSSNDDNQSNYDTASNYGDDQDNMDLDSDDFGGDDDGGSDYA